MLVRLVTPRLEGVTRRQASHTTRSGRQRQGPAGRRGVRAGGRWRAAENQGRERGGVVGDGVSWGVAARHPRQVLTLVARNHHESWASGGAARVRRPGADARGAGKRAAAARAVAKRVCVCVYTAVYYRDSPGCSKVVRCDDSTYESIILLQILTEICNLFAHTETAGERRGAAPHAPRTEAATSRP
jgi:hypothetical protein